MESRLRYLVSKLQFEFFLIVNQRSLLAWRRLEGRMGMGLRL